MAPSACTKGTQTHCRTTKPFHKVGTNRFKLFLACLKAAGICRNRSVNLAERFCPLKKNDGSLLWLYVSNEHKGNTIFRDISGKSVA